MDIDLPAQFADGAGDYRGLAGGGDHLARLSERFENERLSGAQYLSPAASGRSIWGKMKRVGLGFHLAANIAGALPLAVQFLACAILGAPSSVASGAFRTCLSFLCRGSDKTGRNCFAVRPQDHILIRE
ncbi:hypothetical protein FLO80_02985 [Aquicoccus porphyridii]|uniref:Uncharacterized protein n=1 Tax=Aquicoccus porphyridii TaxID=1852029 RepID=A0A5A9ZVC6_9RHOB|nr:hypothetical protein FLO80_02985 [Aquicoccus porphyridii]